MQVLEQEIEDCHENMEERKNRYKLGKIPEHRTLHFMNTCLGCDLLPATPEDDIKKGIDSVSESLPSFTAQMKSRTLGRVDPICATLRIMPEGQLRTYIGSNGKETVIIDKDVVFSLIDDRDVVSQSFYNIIRPDIYSPERIEICKTKALVEISKATMKEYYKEHGPLTSEIIARYWNAARLLAKKGSCGSIRMFGQHQELYFVLDVDGHAKIICYVPKNYLIKLGHKVITLSLSGKESIHERHTWIKRDRKNYLQSVINYLDD
jgi:hypothetical protein